MSPQILCKHLRTKSMFIPALAHEVSATADVPPPAHSAHHWCICTASETGPDDHPVGPQRCQTSRKCFEE